MSKAFDKVWHQGIVYKMKCFGIKGMPPKLLQNFFENRLQRVLLNGQISSWEPVLAGVPCGSILGPLLFLIYINDLSKDLSSVKLFDDDTSIFSTVQDIKHSTGQLNRDLNLIPKWAHQWKMFFLTAIWLPHSQLWAIIKAIEGGSLIQPMLITAFSYIQPKGH